MRRTTTLQEHYNPESRPSIVSSSGSVNESQDILTSPVREKPSPCHRERKMARVDTHTNYTFVSQSLQENPRKKTDNTGTLYKIFQECLKVGSYTGSSFYISLNSVVETTYVHTRGNSPYYLVHYDLVP